MLSNLAKKFTATLIRHNGIDESEHELYNYGFFILFSNIYFLIVVILTSLLLKIPLQGIVFFLTFSIVRQYAGGFHASTETRCTITSTLLIIVSICIIKALLLIDTNIAPVIISSISSVIIALLAPLDSKEKPLDAKEIERFRIITVLILFIINICILWCFTLGLNNFVTPASTGILAECFLLILGKIIRLRNTKNQII